MRPDGLGGAPSSESDIRPGDVVVSSAGNGQGSVFQYDMGKALQGQNFQQTGFLNKPPTLLSTAVNGLKTQYALEGNKIAETIEAILGQRKRLKKTHKRPDPSSDRLYISAKVHADQKKSCDTICGGEEDDLFERTERDVEDDEEDAHAIFYGLIASANQVMKDATIRDRLATEQNVLCFEIEAAGLMNHFPCLVVRGIFDYGDSHKNKAWEGYAAMTAAAYTKDLLSRIAPNKIEAEKKISEVLSGVQQGVVKLRQDVKVLGSKLDKKEDQAILNWMASDDYGRQQSDNLRRRQPGTDQWLLDLKVFKTWRAGEKGSCFCRGMPGAGKTILTAVVVDHLLTQKYSNGDGDSAIGVAFLYCTFSRRENQKPEDLFLSVLKQLSQGLPSLPESDMIKEVIVGAVCGMFLLAQLYFRSLVNRQSRREIEGALADKNKTYEKLYEDTMKRIERSNQAEFAKKALSWVVCARRPLTTTELLHALAVNPGDKTLDRYNIAEMDGVMSACAGLEYLQSGSGSKTPLPDAEARIAGICATYLSFDNFDRGFCATDADLEARLSENPFYGYAARNWGYHAREASIPPGHSSLRSLFGSLSKTEAAGQALMAIKEQSFWSGYSQEVPKGVTALHLAARFGAAAIAKDLLTRCETETETETGAFDVRDSHHRTPLMWAVAFGSSDVVQVLLGSGADPNLKDKDGRTPLSLAAEDGLADVVEALLKEERLVMDGDSQKDAAGYLPLSWAARNGHVDVVGMLLARSDLEGGEADNPLLWAVLQDGEATVKVILEAALQRAGPGWRERVAPKVLCWAAGIGRVPMFTYLLSALEGDVNCRGGDRRMTPLMEAILNSHEEMATALLLGLGADPSLSDHSGRTAFSLAATYGHDALASLLLLHAPTRVEVNNTERDGRTPLSLAAENGHETIVQTLLKLEGGVVNVDARDKARQTPLFWAARNGHDAIVCRLLDTGKVDVGVVTVYGKTALSEAVAGYHVATAKMLEEHMHDTADGTAGPASPESSRTYFTVSTEGPLAGDSDGDDGSGEEAAKIDYDYHSEEDD
ncbi:ankyrin repeat-containing domain protein [Lasiosphaeris hirsuta]|uniref:Ankyrin repeat-containing domain protein n=1 Tax=Lasiosphaeris hirsuta TaxID=260670 RepID=A0AA39ZVX9_9PEZI|nr:ankyrin repeat-containing domain protein [Lasiosphaeris hirsuta]